MSIIKHLSNLYDSNSSVDKMNRGRDKTWVIYIRRIGCIFKLSRHRLANGSGFILKYVWLHHSRLKIGNASVFSSRNYAYFNC